MNYYVVADLLTSLRKLSQNDKLSKEIGICLNEELCQNFTKEISRHDCWFGYLDGIGNFEDLYLKLTNRIVEYKNIYLNFNIPGLSEKIKETKTNYW